MTTSVLLAELAEPDFHTAPAWSRTLGDEVADLCSMVGYAPYPEQRLILDDIFALDPGKLDRSAAFEVAAVTARQQLKTGVIKQAALGWLFLTDQPLVIWSAHEFGTAQEAFRDMQALVDSSDYLVRRVRRVTTAAGNEAIELMSGARLKFKARTSGGGRGLTGSKVILDEAFALMPEHMGALLPTLIAVEDPQVLYASSAGLAKSAMLRALRDRGRVGGGRLAYFEWLSERRDCLAATCTHATDAEGCALDDVDLWRQACVVTARKDPVHMDAIRALRQAMPAEEFMRECLGWWDEPLGDSPISEAVWGDMLDPSSHVDAPRFALDVSPDRDWACIVAAGKFGDSTHVEVTSNADVVDYREGVGWVVPRVLELRDRFPSRFRLTIGTGGGAEAVVPELERAKVRIDRVSAAEAPAACGFFFDAAVLGKLSHLGQAPLTSSVMAARRKNVGERTFVWVRRAAATDITPLYAATYAVWAASGARSKPTVW